MILKFLIPSLFLIFILSNCQSVNKTPIDKKVIISGLKGESIDTILTPYLNELMRLTDNNAGYAIGITNRDSIIYARTFGFENIERGIEADFNTLFHIASLSKPFTAAAIVKLVEQGKINLDDRIIDHLPEFKMKGEDYKNITIKNVLNHTSGIPRHVCENDWLNSNPLDVNLEFARNFELDFEPGSEFSYSNSAFDILGVLVSRVSNMDFTDYVTSNILIPSGMTQSFYNKPIDSLPEHWAAPYSYGLETQEWTPYPYSDKFTPSSGLQTTIIDMCQWGLLHLNKGNNKDFNLFEEKYFNMLVNPYYNTPWGDKIGLSWFLQSYLDRPIIMHTGADSGFESMIYIYPEDGYSIIVMANRDFARTGRIINAASEILFNQNPKDYTISAKYKFSEMYKSKDIDKAKTLWEDMRLDTTSIYNVNDDDILSIGAILENGKKWKASKEILDFYTTLNDKSTYAWRLLGNANLNLKDTVQAIACYKMTQEINPNYTKGAIALDNLQKKEN